MTSIPPRNSGSAATAGGVRTRAEYVSPVRTRVVNFREQSAKSISQPGTCAAPADGYSPSPRPNATYGRHNQANGAPFSPRSQSPSASEPFETDEPTHLARPTTEPRVAPHWPK